MRRSLSTKILIAYGIAFGVSLIGLGSGLLWARRIEVQAQLVQIEVIEDLEDIHQLQSSVSQILIHQLAIDQWLSAPSRSVNPNILATLSDLRRDYVLFEEAWEEFLESDEFGGEEEDEDLQGFEPTEAEELIALALVRDHQRDVEQYIGKVQALFNALDPQLPAPSPAFLSENLAQLQSANLFLKIDGFNNRIYQLTLATEEEQQDAQQLHADANRAQLTIIASGIIISGLLGLILVFLITRSLLGPLKEMTRLTQQSIEEENFDIEIPVRSTDESGVLAETFNAYTDFVARLLKEKNNNNAVLQSTLIALKQSQVQVIQSEKMSSLGQMVSGIAHEINNPLGFISSNITYIQEYTDDVLELLELYQSHYPNPPDAIQSQSQEMDLDFIQNDLKDILKSMTLGSARIREIINSLRNFSRIDESKLVTSSLHENIGNTLLILGHRLKAKVDSPSIQIDKQYGDLPEIECYPGLLNQVFMNILANAIDALEEVYHGKAPDSMAEIAQDGAQNREQIREYRIQIRTSLIEDGRWVEVAIADNGPGIPEAVQQKIFDPFFTTKPEGKGTGMGMSISLQIVTEKHGGRFDCQSTAGQGTTFLIQLPVKHRDRLITEDKPTLPEPAVS